MDSINLYLDKLVDFSQDFNWLSIKQALSQFHFIRPEYLWALVAFAILWLLVSNIKSHTLWDSYIAKDKLSALRVNGGKHSTGWRILLIFGWLLGSIALAGPTWKQVPVPTVRDESAMVIVLDLSRSMLAQDLSPNRLARTKFKLIDILRQRGDGQTALVAYAGDPHTVSPLTDDARTIEALLPALDPSIMPVQGSNTEAAIELALQLLKDAGVPRGDILLLTDGVAPEAQRYIRDLYDGSFNLSILGIGSTDAVPIPIASGGFYSDARGQIILTKLNRDELQIMAGLTGGRYVELQPDDSDISYLLGQELINDLDQVSTANNESAIYDSWEDMGYWLILLALPFTAFSFRKGALYSFPYLLPFALSIMLFVPNKSQALEWQDLWLTADQKGQILMKQGDFEAAAEVFKRDDLAGISEFQANDYESSVTRFSNAVENSKADSQNQLENTYNLGNALSFTGKFEEAIEAYDTVLEQDPGHEDALHNKAVIEQIMQQQESQEGEPGDSEQQEESSDSDEQESADSEQQESGEQSESDSEESSEQDGSQQKSDESQSEQNSEEQQQSEQQQPSQEQSDSEQTEQQAQESDSDQEQGEEAESEQSQEQQASESEDDSTEQAEGYIAEATPEALEDASEQWLRSIPDDPSGLLKRKFNFESRQNQLQQRYQTPSQGNSDEERY